jgi:hypothetical protein
MTLASCRESGRSGASAEPGPSCRSTPRPTALRDGPQLRSGTVPESARRPLGPPTAVRSPS